MEVWGIHKYVEIKAFLKKKKINGSKKRSWRKLENSLRINWNKTKTYQNLQSTAYSLEDNL